MQRMTKDYVRKTLSEEPLWKAGESDTFSVTLSQEWTFTIRKEEPEYEPFRYSLHGRKTGTNETWSHRYVTMEAAFLHIANNLNENANVKDTYEDIQQWLSEKEDP